MVNNLYFILLYWFLSQLLFTVLYLPQFSAERCNQTTTIPGPRTHVLSPIMDVGRAVIKPQQFLGPEPMFSVQPWMLAEL